MRFYTQQHKHYCGIDLHAKAMYVCILDQAGTILVHKNLPTTPEAFLRVLARRIGTTWSSASSVSSPGSGWRISVVRKAAPLFWGMPSL
jgi:predicted NBD/HSP70 family sugar kinase